jgi:sec-independent protein translocase protein TatA
MDFFGIGFGEILLVIVIALIIFGPTRIPEITRTIGRVSRNLRKVTSDFTSAMEREADDLKQPLKDAAADASRDLTLPPPDSAPHPPPDVGQPKGQ